MIKEELESLLSQGEGIRVEFKEANIDVPLSLYETVVSFLNKDGGVILLGVTNEGIVQGISSDAIEQMKQNITTACNNSEFINPPLSLTPLQVEHDGKLILALKIPVSSQVHMLNGVIYERENDSDIKIVDHTRISNIYFRKRDIFTENQIFPEVMFNDLKEDLFVQFRKIIQGANTNHPWLSMSNEEMLRSASLRIKDYKTGQEGYSLACILLFGKDEVIQSILPAYKIDALVRREDVDRYDDRLTLRTNLIETYQELMNFVRKHLASKFYLEADQRKDLRDLIFRELISNILCHREYTSHYETTFIIYKDKVVAKNPNKPVFHGLLNVHTFSPYAKNPNIRKVFAALSWADELGSGVRNITKYLPHYVHSSATPIFQEDEHFMTEIPLRIFTWGAAADIFISTCFNYIPDNIRADLTAKMKNIPVDYDIESMGFNVFIEHILLKWIEKGSKLSNSRVFENKGLREIISQKGVSALQKGGKLFNKRTEYLFLVLLSALESVFLSDLAEKLGYSKRDKFKEMYIGPLMKDGLLVYTIPDKPTSS
ncbi:MAG: RNA-binding domain-containing protein, partial [Candidatus Omnitrophota bacterium]